MKKCFVVLVLFLIISSGCTHKKDQPEIQVDTQVQETTEPTQNAENVPLVGNQGIQTTMNLDSYASLIGLTKQETIAQLGYEYEIRPVGIAKLDQGYYYKESGIACFFNGDQRLQYIEYKGKAQFLGQEIEGDFNSIKGNLKDSEMIIEETLEYMDEGGVREYFWGESICYELSYLKSDYLVSLISNYETGKDFTIYLYKPIGFLNSEEIIDLLDYDSSQIQKCFGMDCIQSGPYEEAFPSWRYYPAIGIYFGVNEDYVEEKDYIQFAPWIEFNTLHAGLTFEEAKKKLGDTLIIKEPRYCIGGIVYSVEYRYEKYFLSLESEDVLGNDSLMQIAKVSQGYRDRINPDVDWNYYKNQLGFVYRGEEYTFDLKYSDMIIPIYDSIDIEALQIPEDALASGYYIGGATGEVESFYIVFDDNCDLNLYVRRYQDSSNGCDMDESYHMEQVIQTDYRVISYEETEELLVINTKREYIDYVFNHKENLQTCFYMEGIRYEDILDQVILKKEIIRDFNKDGKEGWIGGYHMVWN